VASEYGSLVVPVYANTRPLTEQVREAAVSAGKSVNEHMSAGMGKLGGVAGTIGKSVATGLGLATTAAVAFGVHAFKLASGVEAMNASLGALAKANHVSYASIQETIGSLNRLGISTEDAQKTVADLVKTHVSLASATKIAKVAQDESVLTGRSYASVENAITKAVATGNASALKRAGIYVDSKAALQKYADAHGLLVKNLTASEKSQATLNAVLAAGGRVSGAFAAQLKTPAGALRFMKLQADELTISIGEQLTKALAPAFVGFAKLAGAISGAVAPGGKLQPILAAIGTVVSKLAAPLGAMITRLTTGLNKLDPAKVKDFAGWIVKLGPAFAAAGAGAAIFTGAGLLDKLPILGPTLGKLIDPLKQFGGVLMDLSGPWKLVIGGFVLLMAVSPPFRKEVMLIVTTLLTGLAPAFAQIGKSVLSLVPIVVELAKALGPVLATVLAAALPLILALVDVINFLLPILKPLAPVILAVVAAIWLMNVALDANPIALVVLALVGLAVALELVWKHTVTFRAIVVGAFKAVFDWVAHNWPLLLAIITGPIGLATLFIVRNWAQVRAVTQATWHWIESFVGGTLGRIRGAVASVFGAIRNVVASVTGTVQSIIGRGWSAISGAVSRAAGTMLRTVQNLAGGWLSAGKTAVSNLLSGIAGGLANIGGWIKSHVVDPIVNAVKHFFGIHSPSTVMQGLGESITSGFVTGIVKQNPLTIAKQVFGGIPQALGSIVGKGLVSIAALPGKALSAIAGLGGAIKGLLTKIPGLSGLFGGGGGGTGAYAGIMRAVLAHFGIPQLFGTFMTQMNTESGGNPRAINLWDSNAKAGIPSKGLMQVIDPTFNAYAGPYRSLGIWNPLANIYAAVAYALSRYGSSIGSVLGHGHGYASGGILMEPVYGLGLHTGTPYSFGENAPGVPERWSPISGGVQAAARQPIVVNVYPRESQSETEIAAAVSRSLAWAQATGRA
jgi:hypothetical protein